jgi:Peptidase M15
VSFIPLMRRLVHPKVCVGLSLGALVTFADTAARSEPNDQFYQFDESAGQAAVQRQSVARSVQQFRRGRSNLGAPMVEPEAPKSLSGGANITWNASAGCLNSHLRQVLAEVATNYGAITVNSTCRSHGHNAAVGGAAHSYHLGGNAVDFRVQGNVAAVSSFLTARVGGFKHSGGGLFHIDTGPRRPMH